MITNACKNINIRFSIKVIIVLVMVGVMAIPVFASIMVIHGNDPIDDPIPIRKDTLEWPLGTIEVADLSSRLAYLMGPPYGSGQYIFLYRCQNTGSFNEALKIFANIRALSLNLIIRDGPEFSPHLKRNGQSEESARIDWKFTVWNPESWHRLHNNPKIISIGDNPNIGKPVPPPTIHVYVGGGSIVWEEVRIPENIIVIDEREESAPIKPVGGGLITGNIFDMSSGRPIGNAEIVLATRDNSGEWNEIISARSDDEGSFSLEKILAGTYHILIMADGYASRRCDSYNNRGNTYRSFNIELARKASITGIVTDMNGNPIGSVEVLAFDLRGIDGREYKCKDSPTCITDSQGYFNLNLLPKGYTYLWCKAPSFYQATGTLELFPIPSDNIKISMVETGTICGRVVGKDGESLSDEIHVHVCLAGDTIGKWSDESKCNTDGSFEISGIPPGEYVVGTSFGRLIRGEDPCAKSASVKSGLTVDVGNICRPE